MPGSESELLPLSRCEEIFLYVLNAARSFDVHDVEAMLGADSSALTRFANNVIHQNVAERESYLSIRVLADGRTARATTNRFDANSVLSAVEDAVAMVRLQEPDPELLPLAGAERTPAVERWFASTSAVTPAQRATAVAEAVDVVETANQTAAGTYSSEESVLCILNSRGLKAYHTETMAHFSITAMTSDSSGWAKGSACWERELRSLQLAREAVRKASTSRDPVELAPGSYTVILEPAAVLDLVGQLYQDFSATAIRDGRSFLKDRLGEKLFGTNITITDDALHPFQSGPPFDGEGIPRQKLTLVEDGAVRQIAYSRQAAHADHADPTGHGLPVPNEMGEVPVNIVIAGGSSSVAEMIASTNRGVLVTRLWYIREVDPSEKIMTGMTRDGTFLIENGEVVRGVRNFRFNQSLIELLANVEALSPAVRASGEEVFDMVAPAMKVNGFHFTEVTRF